jgi:hypothetical protein
VLRSLLGRLRGDDVGHSDSSSDGALGDDPDVVTESDEDREDEADAVADDGSLWDLIHPWQYRGQYVQSGGDVRDEQERAIQDIQRQAEAIEGSEREAEPEPDSHPDP